jgi:hypothetical protein
VELHVTGVEGVRITSLEVQRPRRDHRDA